VLALGQGVELSFLEHVSGLDIVDGVVKVDARRMTGHPGIFAGGDMVPAERTVTVAVGHGKKAARNIDAYLRGETYAPASKHALAGFEKISAWYYPDAPVSAQPVLATLRRQTTFEEVVGGLDESTSRHEAADVSPAATASSAIPVSPFARIPRCSSSAAECGTRLTTTSAPAAAIAPRNARAGASI